MLTDHGNPISLLLTQTLPKSLDNLQARDCGSPREHCLPDSPLVLKHRHRRRVAEDGRRGESLPLVVTSAAVITSGLAFYCVLRVPAVYGALHPQKEAIAARSWVTKGGGKSVVTRDSS